MALVGDDEVERFDGKSRIVVELKRWCREAAGLEQRALFEAWVDVGIALQHREQALDGGDSDAGNMVKLVRFQVLHIVEFREYPPVVGGAESLKLLQGLAAQ